MSNLILHYGLSAGGLCGLSLLLAAITTLVYHSRKQVFGARIAPSITPQATVVWLGVCGLSGIFVRHLFDLRLHRSGFLESLSDAVIDLAIEMSSSLRLSSFGLGILGGALYLLVKRSLFNRPPSVRRIWLRGISAISAILGASAGMWSVTEFSLISRLLVVGMLTLIWGWVGGYTEEVFGQAIFRLTLGTFGAARLRPTPSLWFRNLPAQCVMEWIVVTNTLLSAFVCARGTLALFYGGAFTGAATLSFGITLVVLALVISILNGCLHLLFGTILSLAASGVTLGGLLCDRAFETTVIPALIALFGWLHGGRTLCDHCLRVTVPSVSQYQAGQRYCEHCGQPVLRSSPTNKVVLTLGAITLPFDKRRVVLANPDFTELTAPIDVAQIYLDTRTTSARTLDYLLTYITNYPPVCGLKQVTIIHAGPLAALGDHAHNALRNTFTRFQPSEWGTHAAGPADGLAYENRAARYLQQRRFGEACRDYTQALMVQPDRVPAYLGRGQALLGLGKVEAAQADCAHAQALAPEHADVKFYQGTVYQAARRYHEAVQAYTAALQTDSTRADIYGQRGQAYASLQDDISAVADLTRAITLEPQNNDLYWQRAQIYQQFQLEHMALDDVAHVLQAEPRRLDALLLKAALNTAQNDLPQALQTYSEAIRWYPEHAELYFRRAEIHDALHAYAQAFNDYDLYLSLLTERQRQSAQAVQAQTYLKNRGGVAQLPIQASDQPIRKVWVSEFTTPQVRSLGGMILDVVLLLFAVVYVGVCVGLLLLSVQQWSEQESWNVLAASSPFGMLPTGSLWQKLLHISMITLFCSMGCVIVPCFFLKMILIGRRLDRDGVFTLGVVTKRWVTRGDHGTSDHHVAFQFGDPPIQLQQEVSSDFYEQCQPRSPIVIRYLPRDPLLDRNAPERPTYAIIKEEC